MNYYEHHLGDYAKDAGYLPMIKEGAYRRLIDIYYNREGPLPRDINECCELARCISKPEREAVKAVLERFFNLEPDGWHQARCDREIAHFRAKSESAKASANARWSHTDRNASGMRTHSGGNANGMLSSLQSPVSSNQTSESGFRALKNASSEKPQESPRERSESSEAFQRLRDRIGASAVLKEMPK